MFIKFIVRFAIVLFSVIALAAIGIHFFSNNDTTTLWILMMPAILAAPILASIVFATADELDAI